jgi:hypothetical protein
MHSMRTDQLPNLLLAHFNQCLRRWLHREMARQRNLFGLFASPNALTASNFSRSHHAVIRVYDQAGNVIEIHEHAGELKEP